MRYFLLITIVAGVLSGCDKEFCDGLHFNGEAAIVLAGQSNHVDAATESWDDYFVGIGSSNRVQDLESKWVPSYDFGLKWDGPIGGSWSLAPGLHFMKKGSKVEGHYGSGSSSLTPFSSEETYHYLTAACGFRYRVNSNFYIEAGPEMGYMLSKKWTEVDNGTKSTGTGTEGMKRLELGAEAGAGYHFGSSGFGAFLRFTMGLTKHDVTEPGYEKLRNMTGQVGLTYKIFDRGKKSKSK